VPSLTIFRKGPPTHDVPENTVYIPAELSIQLRKIKDLELIEWSGEVYESSNAFVRLLDVLQLL